MQTKNKDTKSRARRIVENYKKSNIIIRFFYKRYFKYLEKKLKKEMDYIGHISFSFLNPKYRDLLQTRTMIREVLTKI